MNSLKQQQFPNPYSRLKQKEYGYNVPQRSFLDRHGVKIGAALCSLSAVLVIGGMILVGAYLLPGAIDQVVESNEKKVLALTGVK
jgi:hypothetical protein